MPRGQPTRAAAAGALREQCAEQPRHVVVRIAAQDFELATRLVLELKLPDGVSVALVGRAANFRELPADVDVFAFRRLPEQPRENEQQVSVRGPAFAPEECDDVGHTERRPPSASASFAVSDYFGHPTIDGTRLRDLHQPDEGVVL